MYVHPDARLNGFKAVKIPSNKELFMNPNVPKLVDKHSGSNGENWIEPDMENGVDNLDVIAHGERELSAEAIRYDRTNNVVDKSDNSDEPKQTQTAPATAE